MEEYQEKAIGCFGLPFITEMSAPLLDTLNLSHFQRLCASYLNDIAVSEFCFFP